MTTSLRLAALAGASALALAACASADSPAEPSDAPEPEMSATHDAMGEDDAMEPTASPEPTASEDAMEDEAMAQEDAATVPAELEFTAPTLSGGEFDGTTLAGQDSILWIWASWCPICQAEAPAVAAAAEQLPDGVTLYGLPGNADLASSQDFVEQYELEGMEHIFSEDGSLWSTFGISYQPALVLINDDGTIETIPGASGESGIVQAGEYLAES